MYTGESCDGVNSRDSSVESTEEWSVETEDHDVDSMSMFCKGFSLCAVRPSFKRRKMEERERERTGQGKMREKRDVWGRFVLPLNAQRGRTSSDCFAFVVCHTT